MTPRGCTAKPVARWGSRCSTTCGRGWCSSRKTPGTSTTSRRRRRRAPPIVSPRRTANVSRTSFQAGTAEAPYYTNSSQLPVGFTDDPFEALALQDELQCKYTGGTVLHLYMAEQISSAEACKKLVRNAPSRFRLPYLTVTPTFDLSGARLSRRRARVLPEMRRGAAAQAAGRSGPGRLICDPMSRRAMRCGAAYHPRKGASA